LECIVCICGEELCALICECCVQIFETWAKG
jgi:hypothetical protein